MDDTKTIDEATYTVTIGGTEYQFGQPDPELLERLVFVSRMNAGLLITLEALMMWGSSGASPSMWEGLARRVLKGEVSTEELTTALGVLVKLVQEKPDTTPDAS